MNSLERFSRDFMRSEIERSALAVSHGIDNTIPDNQLTMWRDCCRFYLQQIRDMIQVPIIVTSGYRCPELNMMLRPNGASANSLHQGVHKTSGEWLESCAFDIESPTIGNRRLFHIMARLQFQLHNGTFEASKWNGIGLDIIQPYNLIWEFSDPNDKEEPAWIHVGFVKGIRLSKPNVLKITKDEAGNHITTVFTEEEVESL